MSILAPRAANDLVCEGYPWLMIEYFLGWAVGEAMSTVTKRTRRALSKSSSDRIYDLTENRLREMLGGHEDSHAIVDGLSSYIRRNGFPSDAVDEPIVAMENMLRRWAKTMLRMPDGRNVPVDDALTGMRLHVSDLASQVWIAGMESTISVVLDEQDVPPHLRPLMEQGLLRQADEVARRLAGLDARGSDAPDSVVAGPTQLVGRTDELQRLTDFGRGGQESYRTLVISALRGMGGVGKTALARAYAERAAERFPDGRMEVDLFGFTSGQEPREPDEVLSGLLRQVGFMPVDVEQYSFAQKGEVWRSWLAGRAALLILDNAHSEDQVRPLLPGAGSASLVLITSRRHLDGLVDARHLTVETLTLSNAVTLLNKGSAAGTDPDLARIAALCGRLPLALLAVRPMLERMQPAALLDLMENASRPLEHLDDADRAVRTAFRVSYEHLDPVLREALRMCGFHPGPDFDAGSLAATWDERTSLVAVRLARLLKHSLLVSSAEGRYAVHDAFLPYVKELVPA